MTSYWPSYLEDITQVKGQLCRLNIVFFNIIDLGVI